MFFILGHLSLFLLILSTASPMQAKVAVFDGGAYFPYYGAPDTLDPRKVTETLEAIGIHSDLLDATSLSDPNAFNIQEYAVLIHVYGNTFPLLAAENIRRFHRNGGSILATGVPFCHPCVAVGAAGWNAAWGKSVSLTNDSHTGHHSLKICHESGDWAGAASKRISTGTRESEQVITVA